MVHGSPIGLRSSRRFLSAPRRRYRSLRSYRAPRSGTSRRPDLRQGETAEIPSRSSIATIGRNARLQLRDDQTAAVTWDQNYVIHRAKSVTKVTWPGSSGEWY